MGPCFSGDMPSVEVGELSQKDNGITVDWTIKDFFSYTTEDEILYSPYFSVPGSEWYLEVYPNGYTSDNTAGWIDFYLFNDSAHAKTADYTLGIKNAYGNIEKKVDRTSYVFGEFGEYGNNGRKFLERSELLQRKLELAPFGDLTVTCTLRVHDSLGCSSALKKLSEELKYMFFFKKGCDATVKVMEKEFPIHKSILAARSPVFSAMFDIDMKEKATGVVDIVDCQPETFFEFLAYLYAGEFDGRSKRMSELYKIAHKYDVEELKSSCARSLLSNLSAENFFEAAIIGRVFDESELTSKTQDFFDENFSEIVSTDKWDSFLENNLSIGNQMIKNYGMKVKK